MTTNMSFIQARELLLKQVVPVDTETVTLEQSLGRIPAEELFSKRDVPPFDRSPYDGYALRAADTANASREYPVVLTVIEEVAAGAVPTKALAAGTAVKILTGAPIPDGADAVIMYEQTEFTALAVTVFAPVKSGSNIVRAGEEAARGQLLARPGAPVDAGLIGALASGGFTRLRVYRRPRVALISTGSELTEVGDSLARGMIFNSNRYTIQAILNKAGCDVEYLGIARDDAEAIAERIARGVKLCDAVISTGGVSAGDYDLTPLAMELSGVELLARKVNVKPGLACAYGVKDGKPVCGLSGSPASAVANLYLVVMPALKKLCGISPCLPVEISLTLAQDFDKSSRGTRALFGNLALESGQVCMELPGAYGNTTKSDFAGCDVIAVVPAGSGPLKKGTKLKGYRL